MFGVPPIPISRVRVSSYCTQYFADVFLGIEHPLFVGIESFAASQGTDIINNMYCPTNECRLDTMTSIGLCNSCESENVTFDADYMNGDSRKCINTATPFSDAAEHTFGSNYTALTEYVAANRPYSWTRMCPVTKAGYPEMRVWMSGNETCYRVGPTRDGTDTDGPNVIGALWYEDANFPYEHLYSSKIYSPHLSQGGYWPRIVSCIVTFEGAEGWNFTSSKQPSSAFKLPIPAVSAFTCFRSSSNITELNKNGQPGVLTGQMSHCQLRYCAKRYRGLVTRNNVASFGSVEEFPLRPTKGGPYPVGNEYDQALRAEGLRETFYVGNVS